MNKPYPISLSGIPVTLSGGIPVTLSGGTVTWLFPGGGEAYIDAIPLPQYMFEVSLYWRHPAGSYGDVEWINEEYLLKIVSRCGVEAWTGPFRPSGGHDNITEEILSALRELCHYNEV